MPIPTEWTEALCVGVDALDDDMRILLGVLNQLGQAVVEKRPPPTWWQAL